MFAEDDARFGSALRMLQWLRANGHGWYVVGHAREVAQTAPMAVGCRSPWTRL